MMVKAMKKRLTPAADLFAEAAAPCPASGNG